METKGAFSEGAVKAKLDNFWYYYKWYVIVGAFVVIAAALLITQSCSREKSDGCVYYAGEIFFTEAQATKLEEAFESAMRSDPNGDGKKKLQLITQVILSGDKQAQAMHEAREEEEDGTFVYAGDVQQNKKDHYEQMAYGEAVICLLDRAFFEEARDAGRLATFEEALGFTPEGALDGYGIALGATGAGRFFEILQALPEDTILCAKKPTVVYQSGGLFGKKDPAPNGEYTAQLQILRELLEFSVNE